MIKIGMCPDPFFETEWSRIANPNLVWQAEAIEAKGGKIIPLSRKQAQQPLLWEKMGLDVVHYHWPGAVFNFYVARKPVQKVLPQLFVKAWASYRMKQWEKDIQKGNIPMVWQVHDILSHHAVGYNLPADLILHHAIFRCCDGLVLNGQGSYQPVFEFYGEEKPYAVAPLGSYRALYGEIISKKEAKAQLGLQNTGKVFSYLGTARPKRNAAATVKAFMEVANEDDILLIAGNNHDLYLPKEIDSRIKLYHGVVPKDLFLEILCASDFVVNDGPHYLTSAILRAVDSYHIPVIAYPYGCAIDYAKDSAIWIDDEKGGLRAAMAEASRMDEKSWQKLSDAAAINEQILTWEQDGIACMTLYEKVIQNRKER